MHSLITSDDGDDRSATSHVALGIVVVDMFVVLFSFGQITSPGITRIESSSKLLKGISDGAMLYCRYHAASVTNRIADPHTRIGR